MMKTPLGSKIKLISSLLQKRTNLMALLVPLSHWLNTWLLPLGSGLLSPCMIAYGVQIWNCIRRWGCPWSWSHFEWVWMAAHRGWRQSTWLSACKEASLFLYTLAALAGLDGLFTTTLRAQEVVIAYAHSNGFTARKERYMLHQKC